MIRMYRGALGWIECWDSKDRHEPTHVLLTDAEYGNLMDEIEEKNQIIKELEQHIEKQNNAIRKASARIEKERSNLITKAREAKAEAEYQRGLNRNLLEISRNRANADRDLRPKKEHTGYVVLASKQKPYRYKDAFKMGEVSVWETTIQTPYSIDFAYEKTHRQVSDDLFANEKHLAVKIGIDSLWNKPVADLFKDAEASKKTML